MFLDLMAINPTLDGSYGQAILLGKLQVGLFSLCVLFPKMGTPDPQTTGKSLLQAQHP